MPRTIVQKMTGAMSILIRPTNAVPRNLRLVANSGKAKPTPMPSTTAPMTARKSQCVRSRRRLGADAVTVTDAMTAPLRWGSAIPHGAAPRDNGHAFVHLVRGAGHGRRPASARGLARPSHPEPGRAAADAAGPRAGGRRRDLHTDRRPR